MLRWNGPVPSQFMTEEAWENQLEVDVRKGLEEGLSKQQKRANTCTGEKRQQELAKLYQFTPTVHQLSCGAYVRLSDKLPYVQKLYPSIKEWRIQYDAAGRGVTQVVISPITHNVTADLSPTNVWRLALWKGKESDCFEEYVEQSNLGEDLSEFLKHDPDARVVVLSDWQGLRLLTCTTTPSNRSLTSQCCNFCAQEKAAMRECIDPAGTIVKESDLLTSVLSSPEGRSACCFHGLRVFVSWCLCQTVAYLKDWKLALGICFGQRQPTHALRLTKNV